MCFNVFATEEFAKVTKSEFRSALCSMSFIDASQVPELGTRWPKFRDDPINYFLRCSDADSDAIWREMDKTIETNSEAHADHEARIRLHNRIIDEEKAASLKAKQREGDSRLSGTEAVRSAIAKIRGE